MERGSSLQYKMKQAIYFPFVVEIKVLKCYYSYPTHVKFWV